jgi:hypothetical protein
MLGTLVICLPSKHEGGEVIATHKDQTQTHDSAAKSEYGFSYAAWYSDVRHEIEPVTEGYRLVLTYNLIHRPSTLALNRRTGLSKNLETRLGSWADICEREASQSESLNMPLSSWFETAIKNVCLPLLIHTLEHEYSSAELSMTSLKGADKGHVATLQSACEDRSFELLLCTVEKRVMGMADDDGYDYKHRRGYHHRYELSEEESDESPETSMD